MRIRAGQTREGFVRRWFTERLITPAGTRGLVLRGDETTGQLPNDAVDLFESRHLIRGEDRGGSRWYELSHDRFIEPVKNSNLRWQKAIPSQALWSRLEDRALAWDSAPEEKKPSLLLDRSDLARAESWKNSTDSEELGLSDRLRAYLKASKAAVEAAAKYEAERRNTRRMKVLVGSLSLGAVLLLIATLVLTSGWRAARASAAQEQQARKDAQASADLAEEAQVKAEEAAKMAMASKRAMQGAAEQQPFLKIKHIFDAMDLSRSNSSWANEREEDDKTSTLIRRALSRMYQRSQLGDEHHEITDVAFAARRMGPCPAAESVLSGRCTGGKERSCRALGPGRLRQSRR